MFSRLLFKLAVASKVLGDAERRSAVYTLVHEHSSTASTTQFAATVGFGKKSCGATLMELIVVIAIIAILASIAYPNYLRLKQNTRRGDAQAAVIATQAIVERYLSENDEPNLTSADMTTTELSNYQPGSSTPVITPGGYYVITIVPDSTSYSVNATAIANGTTNACSVPSNPEALDQCADTDCWIISITDGQKQSTNSVGSVANESTTTCW